MTEEITITGLVREIEPYYADGNVYLKIIVLEKMTPADFNERLKDV